MPRVAFIGTRFAGTDGVSLEAAKWSKVLAQMGWDSVWYCGHSDRDDAHSWVEPGAFFGHPQIEKISQEAFGTSRRSPETTAEIYRIAAALKESLYAFQKRFSPDLLIVQNALCIPMNIPLGVAITHFLAETETPCIVHHHDFYWERERFLTTSVGDLLDMAFPPTLKHLENVTINTGAQRDMAYRCGLSSRVVPNVWDFSTPPKPLDEFAASFRKDIGLDEEDIIFLQPTRVVPRKGIEHAIALVAALEEPRVKLVISHAAGDEGPGYFEFLQAQAQELGVDMRLCDQRVGEERGYDQNGQKIYALADAYAQSDFVTYPSLYEGFGNALLEAFYFQKPVLVNRYSVFVTDIETKGFDIIPMNGYLTPEVVDQTRALLHDKARREQMVEHNFRVAQEHFSFDTLRRHLEVLVPDALTKAKAR